MIGELAALGLDSSQLRQCLAGGTHRAAVAAAEADALRLGLAGTPSVFVNGREIALGADPGQSLIDAVEAAVAGEAQP